MNIKNRLEKLECKLLRSANSDTCTCPGERGCDVLIPDPDKSEADRERQRTDWLKPVFCDTCGKQIERQLIEIIWNEIDGQAKRIDTFA